jgi:hypothetical protein
MRPLYIMFAAVTILIAGCSTNSASKYQTRPFFLSEEDLATHGRKSGFDRLIENRSGSDRLRGRDRLPGTAPATNRGTALC